MGALYKRVRRRGVISQTTAAAKDDAYMCEKRTTVLGWGIPKTLYVHTVTSEIHVSTGQSDLRMRVAEIVIECLTTVPPPLEVNNVLRVVIQYDGPRFHGGSGPASGQWLKRGRRAPTKPPRTTTYMVC